MKMSQAHYTVLKSAVNEVLDKHNSDGELVRCYETGAFHNASKVKDLQKRFCFDVLYGTGLNSWVCNELYTYLDDSHIYTALKSICPTVTAK